MSVESLIFDTLKGLVASCVYPDVAPALSAKPYVTYQQVGGVPVNFLDPTVPGKKRSRFQINVWGDTRSEVSALAGQVEDALRAVVALQTAIEGAPIATYEPDTKLRGSMQDFSFLY